MPNMDGTGPAGKGPGTGRRMGRCRENLNKKEQPGQRKGSGKRDNSGGGRGRGKRFRN